MKRYPTRNTCARTALAAAFLLLTLALPGRADQTVVGTGDPTQDVPNVQGAVNVGGTVVLRGGFDFGNDGRVRITRDVRIRGEKDDAGEPATTIRGGFWTFHSPLPVPGATPASKGPVVAVHALRFTGARGTPLHFCFTGGLDVRGCVVQDLRPQELPVQWSGGDKLPFAAGVVVGNRLDSPSRPVKGAAIGIIRIAGNTFDMAVDDPARTAGYGVMVNWTSGADIGISGNTILRPSRSGIEVLDNALGPKAGGAIAIDDNRVVTADEGVEHPHKYGPNGIVAGWYFDTRGGADIASNNRISLVGNRIEGRGERSTGLLLYADDIVATCNDIILAGGREARGIVQTGSRGFFSHNRVRGQGSYAIYCHPFEALQGSANIFAWTELNDFSGHRSQVLLGGNVNTLVGTPPALADKGKGNRVVKAAPCTLPEISPEGDDWPPAEQP
ncbi:MAG: right-handed parallel beta-helix repeat-containing protein [Pseudodesulfovibrio sp.]